MAYIPNGSCPAAERFANDCARCKYGEKHCPIHNVQMTYNYAGEAGRDVLRLLVDDDGNCKVLECFKDDLLDSVDNQKG